MTDRDRKIEQNLPLVHSLCRRFKGRGIEYDDLFSAGCVGLVKAIDNFNPDYKLQLSTYAVPVILGEIKRLFREGGAVKVSRSLKELNLKINAEAKAFSDKFGRAPAVSELAGLLKTTEEKIAEAQCAARIPLSLTADGENDGRELDLSEDDTTASVTEKIALREVLKTLAESDKKIIELRYYKRQTQTVTAKELGMTQVQISRREKKILNYLREKLG